jgi:hypothetical protein
MTTAGVPNTSSGVIRETTPYGTPPSFASRWRILDISFPDSHVIPRMANDVESLNHPPNASAVAHDSGGSSTVQRGQLREEVQKWLSPPDPSTNRNAALQALHEGTAKWFLLGKTLETWKSSGSLLWIHGKRMLVFPSLRKLYGLTTDGLPFSQRARAKVSSG